MFAAVLNSFAVGIVVCDRSGRLLFANAHARERARGDGPLRFRQRALHARKAEETRAIQRLIRDAAGASRSGAIALSGASGDGTVPVLITPLTQMDETRRGLVLVTIGEAESAPSVATAALAKLYRLSRTQASIALAIYAGRSPEEIASERGIMISTVRTHLAAIFDRTRCRTQRDLIRLIGALPPLAH